MVYKYFYPYSLIDFALNATAAILVGAELFAGDWNPLNFYPAN